MAKAKRICTTKERLYELMLYLNITQADIAKKTGLPKPTLSHYCSGKRIPAQDQLSLLSDAYGINPAWLMGYDLPMYMDEIKAADNSDKTDKVSDKDISDFEYGIIAAFRAADEYDKISVLRTLRIDEAGEKEKQA